MWVFIELFSFFNIQIRSDQIFNITGKICERIWGKKRGVQMPGMITVSFSVFTEKVTQKCHSVFTSVLAAYKYFICSCNSVVNHRHRFFTIVMVYPPSCVQAPSRLMMFLCFPIIFIISISEIRSDRSFSVASAAWTKQRGWRSICVGRKADRTKTKEGG